MRHFSNGEINLHSLVIDIDKNLIESGYQPFQRPLQACSEIAKKLGISFSIGQKEDDFVCAIQDIYKNLYRPKDLHCPPLHIGTFMFLDTFLPIQIPLIYGTPKIDPVKCLREVPENILRWIFSDKASANTFFDQWIDLSDFTYGLHDVESTQKIHSQAIEYWHLAKQQLEGSSATLHGSIDKYTVIQNSAIATELLMKGAMLAQGEPEKKVRKYQHNLPELSMDLCKTFPNLDHHRIKGVVKGIPSLVERRYEAKKYTRTEIGTLLMNTQFIAGEILRQFSGRNVRNSLTTQSDQNAEIQHRYYPIIT
ncbi:hypothetical protein CSC3H3_05130 [Thalassospira marina]|uniref:HEPN domain-containing protein n=2 Tax=Thalassospira marina TaxID=2048283 RepID=A0ABM6Q6N4_9PROT|nr:hypothetical protein CSC3H3_05130 [Thalassospira marina]